MSNFLEKRDQSGSLIRFRVPPISREICEKMFNVISYYNSYKQTEKYLPKEKFILVQPESHKKGKGYPFNKIQNIVNYFKDQIKFVQISPETFAGNKSKFLEGDR